MKVSEKNANVRDIYQIKGPFCLDCMGKLVFESDSSTIGICPICSRKHNLSTNYESLRQLAHIRYQAKLDNQLTPISLDTPIQPIKDRDEDEENWVEAKLGYTNDGRKIAVVYLGDKKRGFKVQSFIDVDNEQLRTDRANSRPHEVVAAVRAEFLNSRHIIEKK